MTPTTFVLIHGAFRTGWSWHRLLPLLEAREHRAVAVELSGMGGLALAHRPVGLADWVGDVMSVCNGQSPITLVGHSMGGVVAQAAAGELVSRGVLERLVLIDAPVLKAGQRAVDVSSPHPIEDSTLPPPDTVVPPRPVGPGEGFDDPRFADEVNDHLVGTPFGPSLDRLHADPPEADLWFCTATPATYPSALSRIQCDIEGVAYGLLDSPHDAPLLRPDLVARVLVGEA